MFPRCFSGASQLFPMVAPERTVTARQSRRHADLRDAGKE
jgi:hypothetical protein